MQGSCLCAVTFSIELITGPGTSAYFFEVFELAAFVTPFVIHWASSQFVFLSTVFASSSNVQCICCGSFVSVLDIFCVIASSAFASGKLLITTVWTLWASTFFAHISTSSLHIVIISSQFFSYLMISTSISLSVKPCINCLLIANLFLCSCI